MKNYRVNKDTSNNPNNNNEVHNEDCEHYAKLINHEYLGMHSNCHSAVSDAKARGYSKADGCRICSYECHKG